MNLVPVLLDMRQETEYLISSWASCQSVPLLCRLTSILLHSQFYHAFVDFTGELLPFEHNKLKNPRILDFVLISYSASSLVITPLLTTSSWQALWKKKEIYIYNDIKTEVWFNRFDYILSYRSIKTRKLLYFVQGLHNRTFRMDVNLI